jgi:hypothetical protein
VPEGHNLWATVRAFRRKREPPHARIGDGLARVRVVDHLVDIDRDGPVRLLGEALGLDLARDGGELSAPVVADGRAANHPTALPGVGPIDLSVHQLDCALDVAGVERPVGGPQDFFSIRHASTLTGATTIPGVKRLGLVSRTEVLRNG